MGCCSSSENHPEPDTKPHPDPNQLVTITKTKHSDQKIRPAPHRTQHPNFYQNARKVHPSAHQPSYQNNRHNHRVHHTPPKNRVCNNELPFTLDTRIMGGNSHYHGHSRTQYGILGILMGDDDCSCSD
jgi:hypothetical protein